MNGKSQFCEFCKLMCNFNAVPIPITAGLFLKSENFSLKFTWKSKDKK